MHLPHLGRVWSILALGWLGSASGQAADPLNDPQWSLQHIEHFTCGAQPTLLGPGWDYEQGSGEAYGLPYGWGNNELQYYTNRINNSAIVQSAGALDGCAYRITAQREQFGSSNYTSARVRAVPSSALGSLQPYTSDGTLGAGIRIAARILLPKGVESGLWAALWMLPTAVGIQKYGTWPGSGELDILESTNLMDSSLATLHYGGAITPQPTGGWYVNGGSPPDQRAGQDAACRGPNRVKVPCNQGFHEWAVEWWLEGIIWTLDGEEVFQMRNSEYYSCVPNLFAWPECVHATDVGAPFNTPFGILMNLAVGGNFPGFPTNTSVFPQSMDVDYISVHRQVGDWRPSGFIVSAARHEVGRLAWLGVIALAVSVLWHHG